MLWNTTFLDNIKGYKKPIIRVKVTVTWDMGNYTWSYSTLHIASIIVYHHLSFIGCLLMNSLSPKTVNMALLGGFFTWQLYSNDNLGSSDNSSLTDISLVTPCGKHTNQFHPPHGYGYPPSQRPFPSAPQFYHHSPLNTMPSFLPSTSWSEGFPC